MEPPRTLFSQVGRVARSPADNRSRAFQLVIMLGLLLAVVVFLAELGTRAHRLTVVEVDLQATPAE